MTATSTTTHVAPVPAPAWLRRVHRTRGARLAKSLARRVMDDLRKDGRVRHCYLNPVPIVQLAQRWIDDFGARASAGLLALKSDLERNHNHDR